MVLAERVVVVVLILTEKAVLLVMMAERVLVLVLTGKERAVTLLVMMVIVLVDEVVLFKGRYCC